MSCAHRFVPLSQHPMPGGAPPIPGSGKVTICASCDAVAVEVLDEAAMRGGLGPPP